VDFLGHDVQNARKFVVVCYNNAVCHASNRYRPFAVILKTRK